MSRKIAREVKTVAKKTFAEIARRASEDIKAKGITEEQLDTIVDRARRKYWSSKQPRR
jgi:hypothetical protein